MAVQYFGDNICKDTNIYGENVYIATPSSKGQWCGTIWFKNVSAAKKALDHDGGKTGADLVDCSRCAAHYSIFDPEQRQYPDNVCHDAKDRYARQFDRKVKHVLRKSNETCEES